MTCKNCNADISDGALFCTNCGNKITAETHAHELHQSTSDENTVEKPNELYNTEIAKAVEESQESSFPAQNISEAADSETAADAVSGVETVGEVTVPGYEQFIPENKKADSGKISVGKFIGATVIAIFAVVFLLVFNLIFCARIGLSSDLIRSSANSISLETVLDSELDSDSTVLEYIYDNIDEDFIDATDAKPKDIRNLLIESTLKDFIAESLGGYSEYLIEGSESVDPSITADDVVDFIKDNDDVFKDELNYKMDKYDYKELKQSLRDEGLDDTLSIESLSESIGFELGNAHFVFSFITIGVIFAICLVLGIWIVVLMDKRGRYTTGYLGWILLISGVIFLVPAVAFYGIMAYNAIVGGNVLIYLGTRLLLPFASIAGCTGLFELIVSIILLKIKKHLKKSRS